MDYMDAKLFELLYDPEFRRALRADPKQTLRDLGYDEEAIGLDTEWRIVTNAPDTKYFLIPNRALDNAVMDQIVASGGSSLGTAATAGSLSSAGTATGTDSTIFTVGTVSTAGSSAIKTF